VLGSCGGGRDKWKRPEFGKIAANYCSQIILTNEDPYDERPQDILKDIEEGILEYESPSKHYQLIFNRKGAIKKALSMAGRGDTVIITGKGSEPWMCVANGKKIPWDDRKIVKQEMKKMNLENKQ
jgi:UDP-N-acetylmuramoyl-L-alanyl-D-glutamate--2,6-diaminopimelate ligase